MSRHRRAELRHARTGPGQPEPTRKVEKRLLFALFAAPVAWSIHEVASFGIIGRRCAAQGGLVTWQWALFIGFSVLCFALAAAGLVTAYRMFARWPHERGLFAPEVDNRVTFMAQLGFLLSLILLVNIVLFGILPGIVHPCGLDSILTDTP
jgi:hypothetical protein